MKTLKHFYPLYTWGMLGWLLPSLVALTLLILTLVFVGDNPGIGTTIGVVSAMGVWTICVMALYLQIDSRYRVLDKVVGFKDYFGYSRSRPVAFRSELPSPNPDFDAFMQEVLGDETLIPNLEDAYKKRGILVGADAWLPVTFVTFKLPGTVTWTENGVYKRARGVQIGHWCEVEWLGAARTKSLLMHELSHVLLSECHPYLDESKQHEMIFKAGF